MLKIANELRKIGDGIYAGTTPLRTDGDRVSLQRRLHDLADRLTPLTDRVVLLTNGRIFRLLAGKLYEQEGDGPLADSLVELDAPADGWTAATLASVLDPPASLTPGSALDLDLADSIRKVVGEQLGYPAPNEGDEDDLLPDDALKPPASEPGDLLPGTIRPPGLPRASPSPDKANTLKPPTLQEQRLRVPKRRWVDPATQAKRPDRPGPDPV